MAELPVLTMSNEDYLEAILQLSAHSPSVRSVDVADMLGVSKASVSKAMGVLREAGMIEQPHYGLITLTDEGKAVAGEVLHRHKMLKYFLVHMLGVADNVAEEDACRMEHVISMETRNKWFAYIRQFHEAEVKGSIDNGLPAQESIK
ncbi:metal-dependent transcriptional regulator [Mageeibacillus indolicus]|uniref:Iron dependent repressor DNA binding domain protein n=2 Tax=Mageeibacillus indolicus TaxID=884684 RepID=D3R1D9_MAGIU|nr:metal-dependent transcriptional regulator [Mageeibacillus indolicus]ADC91574.1 iron dependent repressor DNA binding domain protein [Mageeibacillus indolicus UPII9-5]KFA57597.1 DtxR family transcriptional regulator [Mageeibacillus indolicus 0009-5]PNH19496.1 DtxR family transcriptional regulator [Mageeibacillus indolicus]